MSEKITGIIDWSIGSGFISALIAFVLFYGLIHYLPRRSGRVLDRIKKEPVPLIVGLCAAILAFYLFERSLLSESRFHSEVANDIVQFLLLIILGGAVTTLYQARLQAREEDERQRSERVAITARDRQVLEFMRDNLISAYNRVKRVRRLLRARLVYPEGDGGPRFIPKSEYNKQMEQVIEAELEFESILRQIEGNVPLFGKNSRLDGCLDEIEKHLEGTVKEFRKNLRYFAGDPPQMNLGKLPRLERFLGLTPRGETAEAQPSDDTKHRFRDQFRTAIQYLQTEINKLTRRINRTGSILWVNDRPENHRYEIGRLAEEGYEVTRAESTGKAKAHLNDGLKPMLIVSNMGRFENGQFNPEAGLDLLREIGEHNNVYIYTNNVTVAKYREEVQPLGGKGITDSRLLLLKTIDECAEKLAKIDQAEPGKDTPVL